MQTQHILYTIPLHLITQFLDGYSLCQIAQVSKSFKLDADSCESWKVISPYHMSKLSVCTYIKQHISIFTNANNSLYTALIGFDNALNELSYRANLCADKEMFQNDDNGPWQLMYRGHGAYYYSRREAVKSWMECEMLRELVSMDKNDKERQRCEEWAHIAFESKKNVFKKLRGE